MNFKKIYSFIAFGIFKKNPSILVEKLTFLNSTITNDLWNALKRQLHYTIKGNPTLMIFLMKSANGSENCNLNLEFNIQ